MKSEIIAFVSGANVMVLELIASRLLAPYFGSSIYVWASIIGIILTALSLGYYFGGKYADAKKELAALAPILLLAALFTSGILFLLNFGLLFTVFFSSKISAILISILLFSVPSFLFGMVSPFLIRVNATSVQKSGETAGRLYAISTAGSIAGTFAAGFFLIPFIGVKSIILLVSLSTLLLAAIASYKHIFEKITAAFVCLFLVIPFFFASPGVVYTKDSEYYQITVVDKLDARHLVLDNQNAAAITLSSGELVFNYTKFIYVSKYLNKENTTWLFLGAGGCTEQSYLLKNFPKATIDTVEIDPAVFQVCSSYFNYSPSARTSEITEDARVYLSTTHKFYDFIRVDVFNSQCSVPFHISTIEAVTAIKNRLNPNGLVMVNLVSAYEGENSKFLNAQFAAYSSKFKKVYVFLNHPDEKFRVQNIVIAATDSSDVFDRAIQQDSFFTNAYVASPSASVFLTDDYAPVESFFENIC